MTCFLDANAHACDPLDVWSYAIAAANLMFVNTLRSFSNYMQIAVQLHTCSVV
jgi:hypothetical protein